MATPNADERLTTHAPSQPIYLPYAVDYEQLAETTGPDRHLRTICACGDVAEFDPEAWLARGLGARMVVEFSGSLRCPCGRRHARFEVWPGPLGSSGLPVRSASSLYD
jgi:hypothetical protein